MTSQNNLEARVDALETATSTTRSIAVGAARDAQRALRAHEANTRLLTAIRATQAEHGVMIGENRTAIADNRSAIAENRTAIADNRSAIADNRSAIAENRSAIAENRSAIAEVQTTLGRVLVGVHGIESILTRLVENDSSSTDH